MASGMSKRDNTLLQIAFAALSSVVNGHFLLFFLFFMHQKQSFAGALVALSTAAVTLSIAYAYAKLRTLGIGPSQ